MRIYRDIILNSDSNIEAYWNVILNFSWNTKVKIDYTPIINLIFRWIDKARGHRLHRGYIRDIKGNTWFYYNKHKTKLYVYPSRMCGKKVINFYCANYVLGKDLE